MTCAEPPKLSASRLAVHVKKKKQEMTCAEPPKLSARCPIVHVKKEKARNDVCGAAQAIRKMPRSTRQKEKNKK